MGAPQAYRAYIMARRGDFEHALGELDDAARLDPETKEFALYRAEVLAMEGDAKGALSAFEAALALRPKSPLALAGLDQARAALAAKSAP